MTAKDAKKALVIGAGIAGPVAAVALRRAGFEVEVYEERAAGAADLGAIGLSPNGISALQTLGIAECAIGNGVESPGLLFENHRGRQIGAMAVRNIIIKRGPLNEALQQAAAKRGATLSFGRRLIAVEQQAGRVVAQFEDGSSACGDLLIGCDGIHSRTRQAIFPNGPRPVYTGVLGCGGYSDPASVPDSIPRDGMMRMTFGLRGFFAYMFSAREELFWFTNFAGPPAAPPQTAQWLTPDEARPELLSVLEGDHEPIGAIIRSMQIPILKIYIHDLPAIPTWHSGAVCLIGDAAHATSPHVGQGASLAMEDGVELARCLRDVDETEAAFQLFQRLRKPRVERLVREARRSGNQKALSNPFARGLRDLMLPFFLKRGSKKAGQIFAHDIAWEQRVA